MAPAPEGAVFTLIATLSGLGLDGYMRFGRSAKLPCTKPPSRPQCSRKQPSISHSTISTILLKAQ